MPSLKDIYVKELKISIRKNYVLAMNGDNREFET